MDDVLKRLGAVESSVSDIKAEVRGISTQIPHIATKADISSMESSLIKWIIGTTLAVAVLAFTIAKFVHA